MKLREIAQLHRWPLVAGSAARGARAGAADGVVRSASRRHVRALLGPRRPGRVVATQMAIDDFGGKVLGKQDRDGLRRPPEQGRHRRQQGARVVRPGRRRRGDRRSNSASLALAKVAKEKKVPFIVDRRRRAPLTNEDCNASPCITPTTPMRSPTAPPGGGASRAARAGSS